MATRRVRKREAAVIDAAIAWRLSGRPIKWSESEHLVHPAVNQPSTNDVILAMDVAELVSAKKRKK